MWLLMMMMTSFTVVDVVVAIDVSVERIHIFFIVVFYYRPLMRIIIMIKRIVIVVKMRISSSSHWIAANIFVVI